MSPLAYTLSPAGVLTLKNGALRVDAPLSHALLASIGRPWSQKAPDWQIESITPDAAAFTAQKIRAEVKLSLHKGDLKFDLSFENTDKTPIADFSGGLRIDLSGEKYNITLPHVLYNDNPSAAPERIVAHLGDQAESGHICEEHRLPIPAVNACWLGGSLTILTQPAVKTGADEDYWSLGALNTDTGMSLIALSGAVMFSGKKDVVYGGQCTPRPFPLGYHMLAPGEKIEKTLYLRLCTPRGAGQGFYDLVEMGYAHLKPQTQAQHTPEEMVQFKKQVLDSRFYEDNRAVGYICYGDANKFGDISGRPKYFLYSWTGQSIKLAWCDCVLGLKTDETWRLKRGMDAADFFVLNSRTDAKGLYRQYFYIAARDWGQMPDAQGRETISARMEGESLSDLLDLMMLLRSENKPVPAHWEKFVLAGCEFLMDPKHLTDDGVYPFCWLPDGTPAERMMTAAGMPCVTALCKAYAYFGNSAFLTFAQEMYEKYADLHMRDFEIPFARATMDARCEDKEAALPFMIAASALWQLTGEEKYLTYAKISAQWMLTFVYFWETGFLPQTICDRKGFKTTGWPGVSVQNHHLDVFFPSGEMAELGARCGDAFLSEMAQHVQNALTYGVCTYPGEWGFSVIGEQGEQYYHTNYGQKKTEAMRDEWWRGGMHCWNPSWITAQVMQNALRKCYNLPGSVGKI